MSKKISDIQSEAAETLTEIVIQEFWNYSSFIAGTLFGLIIALGYHRLVGRKAIAKSYERLIASYESRISAYNIIISEKLNKVVVPSGENGQLIKRLKKFFKQHMK